MEIEVNQIGKTKLKPGVVYPNQMMYLRTSRRLPRSFFANYLKRLGLKVSVQALREYEIKGTGIDRDKIYALANYFSLPAQEFETPFKNFA